MYFIHDVHNAEDRDIRFSLAYSTTLSDVRSICYQPFSPNARGLGPLQLQVEHTRSIWLGREGVRQGTRVSLATRYDQPLDPKCCAAGYKSVAHMSSETSHCLSTTSLMLAQPAPCGYPECTHHMAPTDHSTCLPLTLSRGP